MDNSKGTEVKTLRDIEKSVSKRRREGNVRPVDRLEKKGRKKEKGRERESEILSWP